MNENKKTFFISDLHLEESRPRITHFFLNFLKTCQYTAKALYILGDLFEVWIGDDANTSLQLEITQAFEKLSYTVPIYFIHGNRDFLIGNHFFKQSGCTLLPDEQVITLNNKKILLMHGDTLCTQDTSYLRFRKIVRNPLVKKIFLSLPLIIRKKIAHTLRKASQKHTQSTMPAIMDVNQDTVEHFIKIHQVDYLIHGHTHRPGIHAFQVNAHPAIRMVLGAWHDFGNALTIDEKGTFELIEL